MGFGIRKDLGFFYVEIEEFDDSLGKKSGRGKDIFPLSYSLREIKDWSVTLLYFPWFLLWTTLCLLELYISHLVILFHHFLIIFHVLKITTL